jgi:uncharacterized membrane protein
MSGDAGARRHRVAWTAPVGSNEKDRCSGELSTIGVVPFAEREGSAMAEARGERMFPTSAGILFGLGLGGFFDGIVLHQILQWHHMVTSAGYPPDSVENLKLNTLLDGLFHASTYVFVVLGLVMLWRAAHRSHLWWSGKLLTGTVLMGFGIFNLVEGLVDHHLLGLHHVNETAPREQWIYWDVGFLVWGAAMFIGGWRLFKDGKRRSPGERD